MRSTRRLFAVAATTLALVTPLLAPSSAEACSSSISIEFVAERHPDLPLESYVAGHIGLIRPTFAR